MIPLWYMILGHAVADYGLQTGYIAANKASDLTVLAAHALIHGAAVQVATGSVLLSMLETAAHFCIDYGRGRKWYTSNVDQSLHLACKLAWAAVLHWGCV